MSHACVRTGCRRNAAAVSRSVSLAGKKKKSARKPRGAEQRGRARAMASWKLFIGGLSWESNEDSLRSYFGAFGRVSDCVIMRDRHSGHPRGFGFVSYADEATADRVAAGRHELDGRHVEAKRAVPRSECAPVVRSHARATKKVFVGGLPAGCGDREFFDYFGRFGEIGESQVMYDFQTRNSRGFGFVTFGSEATVERVVGVEHEILGKMVEVKRAEPKQVLEARRNSPGEGGGTTPVVTPVVTPPAPAPTPARLVTEGGPEYAAVAAAAVALRREQHQMVHVQAQAEAQLQHAQFQIRQMQQMRDQQAQQQQQQQPHQQQPQQQRQQQQQPQRQQQQHPQLPLQPQQQKAAAPSGTVSAPAGLSLHHLREQHALHDQRRQVLAAAEDQQRRQVEHEADKTRAMSLPSLPSVTGILQQEAENARAMMTMTMMSMSTGRRSGPGVAPAKLAPQQQQDPAGGGAPGISQGSLLAPFAPTTASPWASVPGTDGGVVSGAKEPPASALLFPQQHRDERSLEHQLGQLSVSRQQQSQLSTMSPTHVQPTAVPLHKLQPTQHQQAGLQHEEEALRDFALAGNPVSAPAPAPPAAGVPQYVSSSFYGSTYPMGTDLFELPQAVASSGRGGTEQLQPLSLSHNRVDRVERSFR